MTISTRNHANTEGLSARVVTRFWPTIIRISCLQTQICLVNYATEFQMYTVSIHSFCKRMLREFFDSYGRVWWKFAVVRPCLCWRVSSVFKGTSNETLTEYSNINKKCVSCCRLFLHTTDRWCLKDRVSSHVNSSHSPQPCQCAGSPHRPFPVMCKLPHWSQRKANLLLCWSVDIKISENPFFFLIFWIWLSKNPKKKRGEFSKIFKLRKIVCNPVKYLFFFPIFDDFLLILFQLFFDGFLTDFFFNDLLQILFSSLFCILLFLKFHK